MSKRRKFLYIGLMWVAILAAQELLFRFLFPVPEALFNRAAYMPEWFSTEVSVKRAKALCNVIVRWESEPDGFAFDHALNLYGFRGEDFSIDPPADRPRVLFIGDSFVEGCGAASDDTLPRQFSALIGEHSVDAVNLGVAAANFPEYYRLMRDAVPLLRPQAVFLVVCWNDLPAPPFDAAAPPESPALPRLNPWRPRVLTALTLRRQGWPVPRRSHEGPFPFFAAVPDPTNPLSSTEPVAGLYPDLEKAMRAGRANPFLPGTLPVFEKWLRLDYAQAGGVARLVTYLQEFCHKHGAELHVVYIPFNVAANPAYLTEQVRLGGLSGIVIPSSFSDDLHRAQQRHLAAACHAVGIPFIDTTDAFIAGEQEERLFWPIDGHCNAAGYRLLARLCADHWGREPVGASGPNP